MLFINVLVSYPVEASNPQSQGNTTISIPNTGCFSHKSESVGLVPQCRVATWVLTHEVGRGGLILLQFPGEDFLPPLNLLSPRDCYTSESGQPLRIIES